MTAGGPPAGQPGGHRPIPVSAREALQAYGKRRGWARTTRETLVPETTLRNAIEGKNVSRENYDKLVAMAKKLTFRERYGPGLTAVADMRDLVPGQVIIPIVKPGPQHCMVPPDPADDDPPLTDAELLAEYGIKPRGGFEFL
jgi:hypothetical protein